MSVAVSGFLNTTRKINPEGLDPVTAEVKLLVHPVRFNAFLILVPKRLELLHHRVKSTSVIVPQYDKILNIDDGSIKRSSTFLA